MERQRQRDSERTAWVRPLGFSDLVTVKVRSEALIYAVPLSVLQILTLAVSVPRPHPMRQHKLSTGPPAAVKTEHCGEGPALTSVSLVAPRKSLTQPAPWAHRFFLHTVERLMCLFLSSAFVSLLCTCASGHTAFMDQGRSHIRIKLYACLLWHSYPYSVISDGMLSLLRRCSEHIYFG